MYRVAIRVFENIIKEILMLKNKCWLLIFHFFMFDLLNFYQSIAKVRHCYSSHTGKTSALKMLKLSLRYKKKYL